ncbi:hypothetical protein QUF72_07660 [Desulfobacterales bacterium HSG2]|nr:hypothetical protein [Desulfobacterales bacterium HSG2]
MKQELTPNRSLKWAVIYLFPEEVVKGLPKKSKLLCGNVKRKNDILPLQAGKKGPHSGMPASFPWNFPVFCKGIIKHLTSEHFLLKIRFK